MQYPLSINKLLNNPKNMSGKISNILLFIFIFITLTTKPVMLVEFIPGLQLFILINISVFIFYVFATHKITVSRIPFVFILSMMFTLLALISTLYAIDMDRSIRYLASSFPLRPLLFLSVVIWLKNLERLVLFIKILFFVITIYAFHGILQFLILTFGGFDLTISHQKFGLLGKMWASSSHIGQNGELDIVIPRVQSFCSEAAFYMCLLNSMLFSGISLLITADKKINKYYYTIAVGSILLVSLLTLSTAGIFCMLFGLILYLLLLRRVKLIKKKVFRASLVFSSIITVLIIYLLQTKVGEFILNFGFFERFSGTSQSMISRKEGYSIAFQSIGDNIFLGAGYGNENLVAQQYIGETHGQYSSLLISFIQGGFGTFLLHFGILMTVFYVFIVIFHRICKLPAQKRDIFYILLIGVFVGFLSVNLHGLTIPNTWWYINWYLFALAYAMKNTINTQIQSNTLLNNNK